jgi:magnesium transporter
VDSRLGRVIEVWAYEEGVDAPAALTLETLPVRRPDAPGPETLIWIECEEPSTDEIEALGKTLHLHEFVVEDLRNAGQRTKLDDYTDHFHVAVYDCEYHDAEMVTREVDVVFGDGWILSVRQPSGADSATEPPDFPMGMVKRRFEAQRRQHGTTDEGFLLWSMLDVIVDRYFEVTDAIDLALDAVEDVILDDKVNHLRRDHARELFDAGKTLLEFRRRALPLREVTGQIMRGEAACVGPEARSHFQDLHDHVLRVADLLDTQREVVTGLRDADLAVTSNQMSAVQQKIAAWGAILLVATLLTGVLGMNFRNAPELDWEEGFAIIFGVAVLFGIPLYVYFKRKDWL